MKPKIAHLIDILEAGGAQKIVFDICSRLKEKFAFSVWAFEGGVNTERLQKEGIKVRILGTHPEKIGFRYPLALWRTLRWVRKLYRKEQPQIVQTHLLGADMWGRLALPWKTKIIQTIHSAEPFRGKITERFGFKTLLFDRLMSAKTEVIIAVSEAAKKALLKEGLPEKKIKVIYPGIETQKFSPSLQEREKWRRKWKVKENELVIGSVGRLHPVKRYDVFLQALARLNFPYQAVLIGDGPERKKLCSLAKKLKAKVLFLGERKDVPSILNGIDIFVLCSEW
ncbi:glycosyltransferase, partial [bacterium]|nr:glycosyltransferase [bacterium]